MVLRGLAQSELLPDSGRQGTCFMPLPSAAFTSSSRASSPVEGPRMMGTQPGQPCVTQGHRA